MPVPKPSALMMFLMLPVSFLSRVVCKTASLTQTPDPVVDLAENVKGGFEGFFDFLGAGSDDE